MNFSGGNLSLQSHDTYHFWLQVFNLKTDFSIEKEKIRQFLICPLIVLGVIRIMGGVKA
jgi:hypothetical protein